MSSTPETYELRGDVPKWTVSVFEGVRRGRKLTKDEMLSQIMVEWARREVQVATLIDRMTRGNALDSHPEGEPGG